MRQRRYQKGCLIREKRKASPDVWVFRWRDGQVNRKEIVGTVEQFKTKSAAQKALRIPSQRTQQGDTFSPYRGGTGCPLPAARIAEQNALHAGSLLGLSQDVDFAGVGAVLSVRHSRRCCRSWLGTLPLANGTKAKLRNLMHALFSHAMRWEFFVHNPITLVRQSAKRVRVPDVLTIEEIGKLLQNCANRGVLQSTSPSQPGCESASYWA